MCAKTSAAKRKKRWPGNEEVVSRMEVQKDGNNNYYYGQAARNEHTEPDMPERGD